MIKVSKYTKLGFLVLACLTILIWGINFLKGTNLFNRSIKYYAVYERIDGLTVSSPVTINGYVVGHVSKIQLLKNNSGQILVTLFFQENYPMCKGTIAKIASSDIMGSKAIKLIPAHSNEYYQPSDTIAGAVEDDLMAQILPLKEKAEKLIVSLDSALYAVTQVFNSKTRENLNQSFDNLNKTIAHAESATAKIDKIVASGKINSIVSNLDSITATINHESGNVSNIIKNFSSLSDSLSAHDINNTIAGLNKIVQKLNTVNNSAGLLINDPTLYQNLSNLTNNLDLLMKDLKKNPKRYVHFSAINFGRNDKKPAPDDNK